MPKRMNNTAERKQQILSYAAEIFAEKGYYSTTIDEIAERSGVVRGTVLHYFESKEKLFDAVLNASGDIIVGKISEIMKDPDISVTTAISKLIALCSEQFAAMKPTLDSYVNGHNEQRYNFDALRLNTYYRLANLFADLLERGNCEGIFKLSDPVARAESILFAIFGITGAELTSEEIIAEMYAVMENMLGIEIELASD